MKTKNSLTILFCIFYMMTLLYRPVYSMEEDQITAPSAVLIEPKSGKVLFEKNSHEVRMCASITKVMTVLLVFEAIDSGKISIDDVIGASEHAASMGGSDIWLKPGEMMSVDELLKATIIASANDAAVVLAEHVSGSEEAFVSQMNDRAAELGMKETVFKNCNGLDEDGHVTSAYDVALMSRELMKHRQIFKYTSVWIDYLRDGKTQLVNTNKLLKSYKGITGLKTGTTSKAMCCISATAERDGLSLNAVVLGAKTAKDRFKDAATLLDFGFANFSMATPDLPEIVPEIKVVNGMNSKVRIKVNVDKDFLIPKGQEKNLKSNVELAEEVQTPVVKDQVVGKVTFTLDNSTVSEYNIVTDEDVPEISFGKVFSLLIRKLFTV